MQSSKCRKVCTSFLANPNNDLNYYIPCYSQVHSHDLNLQSVLVHAITEIGVEHIIVAGHTNCGALAVCVDADSSTKSKSFPKRSLDREPHSTEPFHSTSWPPPAPLDEWLADLRHIAVKGKALSVEELTEENVKKQVENVMKSKVVQKAWAHEGRSHLLGVHGWVYDVETGLVKDLGVSKYGPEPKHWVGSDFVLEIPVSACG